MKLEDELKLYGAKVTDPAAFCDILADVHHAMCPSLTVEQLTFRPSLGVVYIAAVRGRAGEGLPEEMILRRLTNIRKRGTGEDRVAA